MLRKRGIGIDPPRFIARTGWTTSELEAAIDRERPEGPFALVSLLIGVNNQYRGLPVDEYEREFARLLETAVELTGGAAGRVLVLPIPDWGVTPFAEGRDRAVIAKGIDAFNAVNRRLSLEAGARYADTSAVSRRAAVSPELTAADGLHPSGLLYRRWAEVALSPAVAACGGPDVVD